MSYGPEKSKNMNPDKRAGEFPALFFVLSLRRDIRNGLWKATDETLGMWSANRK
jgi:hypothetical protein